MVEWTVVKITNNFDVFVTINNKGRFYFNKRILKLCKQCSFKYVKPLISSDKKRIGFKFSMKYDFGFYGLKFTNDHCILYCSGLGKICLKDEKSNVFPLFYDEEENVWYFKINS